MKFGQLSELILRKIIKIVATRCQILMPKCTKFNFGWGSVVDRVNNSGADVWNCLPTVSYTHLTLPTILRV